MNISLDGWFENIRHKTKTDKAYFDLGAHVFCVHMYNFAEVAIQEKNSNALSLLCKLGALTYVSKGKTCGFCLQMEEDANLLEKYCKGEVDLELKITLPERYLSER